MEYPRSEPFPAESDDSVEVQLGFELRRLWHAATRGATRPPALEGLAPQQYWVLGALAHGPRRMTELAECSFTSHTSLTGIVDRLEERGLLRRTRSAEDRRVVEVELTDEGREVMEAANAEYLGRIERLLEPLDPPEREALLALIRRLTARRPDRPTC